MLQFFRNIRQKLIREGQLSRYLLYAIGEIILVVIGILIALQINNWNEWRKEREREKIVLEDIRDNISRNDQLIELTLEKLRHIDRSTDTVKSLINTKSAYYDSLSYHFSQAIRHGGFLLRLNLDGYESLKNAGFDIIRNENLKDQILSLFEVTYSSYDIELKWSNEVYSGFYGWWDQYFHTTEEDLLIPIDYDQILESRSFLSKINETIVVRESIKKVIYDCQNHNKSVLQLINDELLKSELH